MKPAHLISTLCFALLAMGCKEESGLLNIENQKPDVIDLSDLKDISDYENTVFLVTPQNELPAGKNVIYCSSLLLAWDKIKSAAGDSLIVDKKYNELWMLNNCPSPYINTLNKGEYETLITTVDNGDIVAYARFHKSLPFESVFETGEDFAFKGNRVASFRGSGKPVSYLHQIHILYYKDDNNFIVKLQPKDTLHEIILCMMDERPQTMAQAFKLIESNRNIGESEKNTNESWKYNMNMEDEMIVPKIKFHIEEEYKSFVNNKFKTKEGPYSFTIKKVAQRTAFRLDERGAEIESEALVAFDSIGGEVPKLKKMIFNKPFLVMLKRVDSPNPYFAMWVDNTELMIKE